MPLDSTKAFCLCGPQGTPEIKEHYIDSKKDVDRHLKFSCEQFIQQQTQIFVGNLEEFLTRVNIRANAVSKCSGSSWPVPGPWLITWFLLRTDIKMSGPLRLFFRVRGDTRANYISCFVSFLQSWFVLTVSAPRSQLSKRWPSKAAPRTGCLSNLGRSQVRFVSGKDPAGAR